jgi:glycerate 2-kinase
MRVLLSPNGYKDCLTAARAADLMAAVLGPRLTGWQLDQLPITDGGEGFVGLLTGELGGDLTTVRVSDPLGRPVDAQYGEVAATAIPGAARARLGIGELGRVAIVEMAQASGIQLLAAGERDGWQTSSEGTGQLLAHARQRGVAAIVLGIGGSATNDLGVGALMALGLHLYDHHHQPVTWAPPAQWRTVATLGYGGQRMPLVRIACDVDNPLLGDAGATHQFGGQKGVAPADRPRLDAQLARMSTRLGALAGRGPEAQAAMARQPGMGAAGGIGCGLKTLLGDVDLVAGYPLVSDWLGLPGRLAAAQWVISGEGAFDRTSIGGKGPWALLQAAGPRIPFDLVAGRIDFELVAELQTQFPLLRAWQMTPPGMPLDHALASAPRLMAETMARIPIPNAVTA